ncbi:MAG: diacylglycerol kinase family lipid kinase [bacterium]
MKTPPSERLPAAGPPRQAVLILNPVAGRGRARKREPAVLQALCSAGMRVELLETEAPGHATELARRAHREGAELIIAAGGDGTVHEVAQGVWGTDAVLGVLPLGSGNDFATSHRIPRDLEAAARVLTGGPVRVTDVGRFGDRAYFNTMGIGFTVEVTAQSRRLKRLRGIPLYLAAVMKSFASYASIPLEIETPGFHRERPTYFITVAIGVCEGGGFHLTPDALTDDGLFDVCIVDHVSTPTALRILPRALKGTHTGHETVTMLRVPTIRISAPHDIFVHADGQLYDTGRDTLVCTCERGALRVRVPG